MKAIVFTARLNSLFSIRIPFTWQSALIYPVLPPSAVIGMLANALQRHRNDRHPSQYLSLVENDLLWVGSRLLSPCVIKSYTTSAIVKWEDILGGKFTNALGRQFGFVRNLQIVSIFERDDLTHLLIEALRTSPLTAGDSESLISIEDAISEKKVSEIKDASEVVTYFYIPFDEKTDVLEGNGIVYLMHERCQHKEDSFPLRSYLVPVREEEHILKPSYVKVECTSEKVLEIEDVGRIVTR